MSDRPDPAALAEAVKGLDDDALAKEVQNLGSDQVLRDIFQGMKDAFRPDKAKDTEAVIQYVITTEDGERPWIVHIHGGACEVSEGTADDPRITLRMKITDFVRLIFNQVEAPALFMRGKLKVKGDMMFGMQMQSYFDRNF